MFICRVGYDLVCIVINFGLKLVVEYIMLILSLNFYFDVYNVCIFFQFFMFFQILNFVRLLQFNQVSFE